MYFYLIEVMGCIMFEVLLEISKWVMKDFGKWGVFIYFDI